MIFQINGTKFDFGHVIFFFIFFFGGTCLILKIDGDECAENHANFTREQAIVEFNPNSLL